MLFALLQLALAPALDNGLALTPPMGWRSWNAYRGAVTQANVSATVDAIVDASRGGVSLLSLGYANVGTDDGWQACGTGRTNKTFHDASGKPLINLTTFSDIKAMVAEGHKKGVTMGWYDNNCMCCDGAAKRQDPIWAAKCNAGDVQLLLDADFDAVKIDNCGDALGSDFTQRAAAVHASGHAMMIENSNQGFGNLRPRSETGFAEKSCCADEGVPVGMACPGCNNTAVNISSNPLNRGCGRGNPNSTVSPGWCPYNMFRTSGDIGPGFAGIMDHLESVKPYLDAKEPISRPGCWAYPDMLEVGNIQGPLNFTESRSHFGAWCIVSAPLIIGMDITSKAKLDEMWPILANKEAIEINQLWAGHPGRFVAEGGPRFNQPWHCPGSAAHPGVCCHGEMTRDCTLTSWTAWAKAMPSGGQAVFVVSRASKAVSNITLPLAAFDLPTGSKYEHGSVRDVWKHADGAGYVKGENLLLPTLGSHDSVLLRFSAKSDDDQLNSGEVAAPPPPSAACLQQLLKDKCLPAKAHACLDCAEKHAADLKAPCKNSEKEVEKLCEHPPSPSPPLPPSPPPAGPCDVALMKQLSKRACTFSASFGCCSTLPAPAPKGCNATAIWTSTGCRGEFTVDGKQTTCNGGSDSPTAVPCVPVPPPPALPPVNGTNVTTVLVFGDSWGSLGPSWHEIQDSFDRHGVPAVVRSAARGGTEACQWAADKSSLAKAAAKLFPELGAKGPDHVWYTLGGNDFANKEYQSCSKSSKSLADELVCIDKLTDLVRNCTASLLETYWKSYPLSRVMQCGYDFPCATGRCMPAPRIPFCKKNVTCTSEVTLHWQGEHIGELQSRYTAMHKNYTGLNVLGTVQMAGGVPGAAVGKPIVGTGSPCDLMTECVHPTHGKAGATAVGEAFWSLYFSKYLKTDESKQI